MNDQKFNSLISSSVLIAVLLIIGALFYAGELKFPNQKTSKIKSSPVFNLEESIIPSNGVELPIKWGNFGKQLVDNGVIDAEKFESIYIQRGGLLEENKKLLYEENNGNLIIDSENAGYILNLLWAFGLANKNPILEQGPMVDKQYGGAGNFASTGGWTMAKGDAMNHYSKHQFIDLTNEQQALVELVSKNIYRPCCGNSTYFPDCNHGMAMLGFLELMAVQGVSEQDMYRAALYVNSYWFPDTYLAIARYFENQDIDWKNINPKDVLGSAYSSASGYQRVLSEIEPLETQKGGSCGV